MKYIKRMNLPSGESGNDPLKDPLFDKKMQDVLKEVKPETAYLKTICGNRDAFVVLKW